MEKTAKTPITSKTKPVIANSNLKTKENKIANKTNNSNLISLTGNNNSNKIPSTTNSNTTSKTNNITNSNNNNSITNAITDDKAKPAALANNKIAINNNKAINASTKTINKINLPAAAKSNPSNNTNKSSVKATAKTTLAKNPAAAAAATKTPIQTKTANITLKNNNNTKSALDISINFLNLREKRTLPPNLTSHLPATSLSKTKTAESYNIPSNPIERVNWIFSLFKSKASLISYARSAPQRQTSTLDSIANYLNSFSEDILEKYILIFSWVALNIQYDTNSYFTGKIKAEDCSPAAVFRNGSGVCSGYATIFGALCEKLNLSCLAVTGYAKGFSYRKGESLRDTNHEWNLVLLGEEWFCVETTWASGKVGADQKFKFEFNPFYFFCPPQFFIEDHLPQSVDFQLLESPFSKSQFETAFLYKLSNKFESLYNKLGVFKPILPDFFVIDYDTVNDSTHDSNIKKQEFQIIKLQNFNKEIIANLYKHENTNAEIKIENRVFIKTLANDELEILYKLPASGNYELKVFEREKGSDESFWSFISYIIHAKNVEKNNFEFVKNIGFKGKYELIEPYCRLLKKGMKIEFKLKIEDCFDVAVIQDKDWTHMRRSEMQKELWEGIVEIKQKKISVFVQKAENESFTGVFEYEGI